MLISRENAVNTAYDAALMPPVELRRSPVREILRVLRRNKLLIALVTLAVMAVGAAITFSLTKMYTATATVMLRQSASDPLASPDAQAPRPDESAPETMTVVFKSRDLAQKVVEKIGYEATARPEPWYQTLLCRNVGFLPASVAGPLCPPSGPPPLSNRVDAFLSHLSAETVGRSRALTLSFVSEDPKQAATALNELIAAEEAAEQEMQGAQLENTAKWLEARAAELQRRWLQAEQRVAAFRSSQGLTQTSAGGGAQPLILQQIGNATTTLSQAEAALAAATARATTLTSAARTDNKRSLVRMAEQPVISAAAVALNELYSQRARITQQYGPDYPQVASLSRQIGQAESNLNGQIDASLQAVRSEVAEKQAQVASLTRSLDALRAQFNSSSSKETEATSLEGEAKAAQLSYQAFLSQSQRYIGRSDIQQPVIGVIAYAHTPDLPSFPRKSRFLLAATVLGLVAGCALAFTREHLWTGFSEISRIGYATSLPLVATVELVRPGLFRNRKGAIARYVARRPFSAAAEAARSMLAAIAMARDSNSPQVVSVASVTSGEGKSVISIWLASVAVAAGHRVLLIDCDHRAGTVAASLGGRKAGGLADALDGTTPLADLVQVDRQTGIEYIASTRGAAVDGSFDIDRIRARFAELKRVYKLIILDTPPLLATSDALVYCSAADQTLFVCRWRSTSREAVYAALERFRAANIRLTGLVMSMVTTKQKVLYSDTMRRRDQLMLKQYYHD